MATVLRAPEQLELVADEVLAVVEVDENPEDLEPAGREARKGAVEKGAVGLPVELAEIEFVA